MGKATSRLLPLGSEGLLTLKDIAAGNMADTLWNVPTGAVQAIPSNLTQCNLFALTGICAARQHKYQDCHVQEQPRIVTTCGLVLMTYTCHANMDLSESGTLSTPPARVGAAFAQNTTSSILFNALWCQRWLAANGPRCHSCGGRCNVRCDSSLSTSTKWNTDAITACCGAIRVREPFRLSVTRMCESVV